MLLVHSNGYHQLTRADRSQVGPGFIFPDFEKVLLLVATIVGECAVQHVESCGQDDNVTLVLPSRLCDNTALGELLNGVIDQLDMRFGEGCTINFFLKKTSYFE